MNMVTLFFCSSFLVIQMSVSPARSLASSSRWDLPVGLPWWSDFGESLFFSYLLSPCSFSMSLRFITRNPLTSRFPLFVKMQAVSKPRLRRQEWSCRYGKFNSLSKNVDFLIVYGRKDSFLLSSQVITYDEKNKLKK